MILAFALAEHDPQAQPGSFAAVLAEMLEALRPLRGSIEKAMPAQIMAHYQSLDGMSGTP